MEIEYKISIALFISFLLGLLSTFIVEYIKGFIKRNRIRKLTIHVSENLLNKTFPLLRSEYERMKTGLQTYSAGDTETELFEGFSSDIYRFFNAEDYFKTFKKDFSVIDEVRNIMDIVKRDRPFEIVIGYFSTIKAHLKEKQLDGKTHEEKLLYIVNSDYCQRVLLESTRLIDCRLKDIDDMETSLNPLVVRHKTIMDSYENLDDDF